MFSSSVFPSLLYSFNLKEIAQDAYNQHQQLQQNKQDIKIKQYKFLDLFTQEGINLCELFGYHLAQKTKTYSLKYQAEQKYLVWLNYQKFEQIMINSWINMGEYSILLPALFKLFKSSLGGFVNMKHVDQFAQISFESIKNDLISEIKYKVSPTNLKRIKKKVYDLAQKQDMRNSGFLQKIKINKIFTQVINSNSLNFDLSKLPSQLLQNDLINYQFLFNEQYLFSGYKVKNYMLGFCARKIVKVIKQSNKKKILDKNYKTQLLKKAIKGQQKVLGSALKKNPKLVKKQQKKQIVIANLLQKDTKQVSETVRNKLFTAKQILFQIIFDSVEIAQNTFLKDQNKKQKQKYQQTKKTIFTVDPVISQNLYGNKFQKNLSVQYMSQGLAFFINKNEGFSFEMNSNSDLKNINLQISSIVKNSKIVDFLVFSKKLYIIRQDGLFYMWKFQTSKNDKDCYQSMVQTSFKSLQNQHLQYFNKQLFRLNKNECIQAKRVIFLDKQTNIILVNCSQDAVSPGFELYDLSLQYLGKIPLNKNIVSFTHNNFKQAQSFLAKVSQKTKADQIIKTKDDYLKLFQKNNCSLKSMAHQNLLGQYILQQFQAFGGAQVQYFQSYYKYITNNKNMNKIPLNQNQYNQLTKYKAKKFLFKQVNLSTIKYLSSLNYIKNESEEDLRRFIESNAILCIKDRKNNLLSLFEDNYSVFQDLVNSSNTTQISKLKLLNLLKQCDLIETEALSIIQNLPSTPDSLIEISSFLNSQHASRVVSLKQNKMFSKHNSSLVLPSVFVNKVLPILKLGILVFTVKEGINKNKVFIINFKGQLINQITFNKKVTSNIFIHYVPETEYLLCLSDNNIYIYNCNYLAVPVSKDQTLKPSRFIQNLEISQGTHILDINFSYIQNSFFILGHQSLLIFDFQQLIAQQCHQKKYKIKPGYIAIMKDKNSAEAQSQLHEAKRKYLTNSNQQNSQFLMSPTKYGQNFIAVISYNPRTLDLHIKSFYLFKHTLKVTNQHLKKQLPLKLFKQIQSKAKRNFYQDSQIPLKQYSQQEIIFSKNIIKYYKNSLSQIASDDNLSQNQVKPNQTLQKERKVKAITSLNNVYGVLRNIKNIINSTGQRINLLLLPQKVLKTKLILEIFLSKTDQQLKLILSPSFMNLYKNQNGEINKKQILNDVTTSEQKKFIQRLLYFCSLIDKYLLPAFGNDTAYSQRQILRENLGNATQGFKFQIKNITQLICIKTQVKNTIDQNKMPRNQSISKSQAFKRASNLMGLSLNRNENKFIEIPSLSAVRSTFQALLDLQHLNLCDPFQIISQIMTSFIPTKFKYLCPRYFKQIIESTQNNYIQEETQPDRIKQTQFFSINFLNPNQFQSSQKRFIQDNITNQINQKLAKQGLRKYLNDKNLYYRYLNQIQKKYPEVKRNYRKLIQLLFSFKFIDTCQMIFLITLPEPMFVDTSEKIKLQIKIPDQGIDIVLETINQNIQTNHIKLPKPFITVEYFKSNLYKKSNAGQIFIQYFNQSNQIPNQIYTRKLTPLLQISGKKNVSLDYNFKKWSQIVSDKVVPLLAYSTQIEDQFSGQIYLGYQQFKNSLQSYIQTNLSNLAQVCIQASLPNTRNGQILKQKMKVKPNQFYVNTENFVKYLNQFKKSFFSKLFTTVSQRSLETKQKVFDANNFQNSINLSVHNIVHNLWISGNFLDKKQLLRLISYSLNKIGLQDANTWIQNHVNWVETAIVDQVEYMQSLKSIQKKQSQLKKQLLIDPIELKFINKHLQKNMNLTFEQIAWKLFQIHQSLDFVKALNSKCAIVEGNVSIQQIYKFMQCESIARWLFKIKPDHTYLNLIPIQNLLKGLSNILCQKI